MKRLDPGPFISPNSLRRMQPLYREIISNACDTALSGCQLRDELSRPSLPAIEPCLRIPPPLTRIEVLALQAVLTALGRKEQASRCQCHIASRSGFSSERDGPNRVAAQLRCCAWRLRVFDKFAVRLRCSCTRMASCRYPNWSTANAEDSRKSWPLVRGRTAEEPEAQSQM